MSTAHTTRIQHLFGLPRRARLVSAATVAMVSLLIPRLTGAAAFPPPGEEHFDRVYSPPPLLVAALSGSPSPARVREPARAGKRSAARRRRARRGKHTRGVRGLGIRIRKTISRALKRIPSAAEIEAKVRKALQGFSPKKIVVKVRKALSKLKGKGLRKMIDSSVSGALKAIPSAKKLIAIVKGALKAVPSAEKLTAILKGALKAVPSAKKLKAIVKGALKAIPDVEKIADTVEKALEGLGDVLD